jgi:hypothetical protein
MHRACTPKQIHDICHRDTRRSGPSALRRQLALAICTAAKDRDILFWEEPGEARQIAGALIF